MADIERPNDEAGRVSEIDGPLRDLIEAALDGSEDAAAEFARELGNRPEREKGTPFAELMEAARAGSKQAAEEVIRDYGPYIKYAIRRLYCSEPHISSAPGQTSLFQECLVDISRGLPYFKGCTRKRLRAWIRKVAKNNCADANRRRVRLMRVGVPQALPADDELAHDVRRRDGSLPLEPGDEIEQRELLDAMQAALESLPEKVRAVVLLRHADDLTYRQIAEKTGRSPKAVQKICDRALKQLRRKLDPRQEAAVRRRPK